MSWDSFVSQSPTLHPVLCEWTSITLTKTPTLQKIPISFPYRWNIKLIPGSIPVLLLPHIGGHYAGGCRLLRQLEASSIFGGHGQSGRGSQWVGHGWFLGGGQLTPEPWGRWTHFDLRIFFKWVGSTSNLVSAYSFCGGSFLQKPRTFGTFLKTITVVGPQKAKQDSMGKLRFLRHRDLRRIYTYVNTYVHIKHVYNIYSVTR